MHENIWKLTTVQYSMDICDNGNEISISLKKALSRPSFPCECFLLGLSLRFCHRFSRNFLETPHKLIDSND